MILYRGSHACGLNKIKTCSGLHCETWRRQTQAKKAIGNPGEGSEKKKGEFRMKKHNMMRVASAMAVVTLLSTGLISGTLAKYTSTTNASSTATVAKWSFLLGNSNNLTAENDITGTPSWNFNIFDTVKDSNSTEEEHVANKKIAPGTSGSVDLYLENASEVAAKYSIKFECTNNDNIPLKYALVAANAAMPASSAADWKSSIADLDKTDIELAAATTEATTDEENYRLYWKWEFDDDSVTKKTDVTDLALGIAETAPTATIKATVTATQVD